MLAWVVITPPTYIPHIDTEESEHIDNPAYAELRNSIQVNQETYQQEKYEDSSNFMLWLALFLVIAWAISIVLDTIIEKMEKKWK